MKQKVGYILVPVKVFYTDCTEDGHLATGVSINNVEMPSNEDCLRSWVETEADIYEVKEDSFLELEKAMLSLSNWRNNLKEETSQRRSRWNNDG